MNGYGEYGSKIRRRSGIMAVVDFLVLVITVIFALLLLSAFLAKYIDPRDVWFFAFAGLGAPILFVANILLMLYWVVRWRLYVLIPLAVLLLGAGNIALFFRPGRNAKPETAEKTKVVFMTYNVMGFMDETAGGVIVSDLAETAAFINGIKPDILCIQEYQTTPSNPKVRIDSLLGMRYNIANITIPGISDGGWGIAIYSRYPIVDNGVMDYEGSVNSSMWADIKIGADTLRIINNHLETTSVDRQDRQYIDNQEFLSGSYRREEIVRSIVGKLRRGFRLRASQADSVALAVKESPYKVIVCGDFNDTPLSYTYHTTRGPLKDAFVEKGAGMPSTFNGLFNMFRIDYVLHSQELRVLSYDSPESAYSDHKPVVVEFDI